MPWIHQDLGGHTGNPSMELYVRFLEWGCLSPATRVHCTRGKIRYPWAFGDEAQRIVTEYIKLRYRLAPTLYSAARRTFDDGTPMLRRCDLYWPAVPPGVLNAQYLLGDDILVAPIVRQATSTAGSQPSSAPAAAELPPVASTVWIPPGTWQDAWTGARVEGPAAQATRSDLWHTPMFIRAGGIVLLAPPMQYELEKPWDPVTAEAFVPAADGQTRRELYEDDGQSVGYLQGQFRRTPLTLSRQGKRVELTVGAAAGEFPGQLKARWWVVRFHLPAGQELTGALVDGQSVPLLADDPPHRVRSADLAAWVMNPAKDPPAGEAPALPLTGPGARPASQEGPIVEIVLPSADTARPRTVGLMLK